MNKKNTTPLFSHVAKKYDFLNHLLSLNVDKRWRMELVSQAAIRPGNRILDLCTGTSDIAIEFARRDFEVEIIGIDICDEMLDIGRQKIKSAGLVRKIKLLKADVLNLPFYNDAFDIVSIGFGLRNLLDYRRGISEMVRVTKEEGKVLILEFSLPQNALLSSIYQFYLKTILPPIGGVISGSKTAYEYLSSSILNFTEQVEILELMKDSELQNLYFKKLTGGIAILYRGERLGRQELERQFT